MSPSLSLSTTPLPGPRRPIAATFIALSLWSARTGGRLLGSLTMSSTGDWISARERREISRMHTEYHRRRRHRRAR